MKTRQVEYQITINGKDATKDLSPFVLDISYRDHRYGVADELSVSLDNADRRFSNEWFMSPGMIVGLTIDGMNCGSFTIDDNDESGSSKNGHVASFSAQSAGFTAHIRSKNSFTHEGKKLKDLVKHYTDKHKLKLVGTPPDLTLGINIQTKESDIDFLHRLGMQCGCVVALKGDTLVFEAIENIWQREAAATLRLTDDMEYKFKSCLSDSPDGAINLSVDPYKAKVIGAGTQVYTVRNYIKDDRFNSVVVNKYSPYGLVNRVTSGNYAALDGDYDTPSKIVHLEYRKVYSHEEAMRVTTGQVVMGQLAKYTGMVKIPGNILCVAGNTINILEVGKRSGLWLIDTSTHHISKGNAYDTTLELCHGLAVSKGRAPDVKKEAPGINYVGSLDRNFGNGRNRRTLTEQP